MVSKIYSYVLKSASGDYYHTITTKDYKDVYDYMKNEANGEYEAWKAEWDPAWGEFDETHIDYSYYDKQSLPLKSSWKPSDEDERKLQKCIKIVERWEEDYDIAYAPYSGMLKSLRPHWKPSEEQDYSGLSDLERAIHRGFLCAGVENVSVTIIKETAQDCIAHLTKPEECQKKQQLTWKDVDMILKISADMLDDRENSPIGLEKEWCQQVLKIFNLKKHE